MPWGWLEKVRPAERQSPEGHGQRCSMARKRWERLWEEGSESLTWAMPVTEMGTPWRV